MATKSKKALHAYVSNDAHDMWHDFAAENGVSVSALLEVFAVDLKEEEDEFQPLVVAARRIDASRRRRTR